MSVIYRALRNLEQREANAKRGILHSALLRLENGQRNIPEQKQPSLLNPNIATDKIVAGGLLSISNKGHLLKEQCQRQFKKLTALFPNSHGTEGQRFSSILGQLADRVRRPQAEGMKPKKVKRNYVLTPALFIVPLLMIIGGRIWFLYQETGMDSLYQMNLADILQPVGQGVMPLITHFLPEQATVIEPFTPQIPKETIRPILTIEQTQNPVTPQSRLVLEKPSSTGASSTARLPVVLSAMQHPKETAPRPPQDKMSAPTNPAPVRQDPPAVAQEKPLAVAKTQTAFQRQEAIETPLSNTKKVLDDIAQMVIRLEKAIAQGDSIEVGALFDALSLVKQADDTYLLNMRAYWHMTQREYAKAEIYLKQVLMRNSEDLEAGLNLAIIEAHTNRTEDAQQRLHLLSQRYPTESRLHYVLNTLR